MPYRSSTSTIQHEAACGAEDATDEVLQELFSSSSGKRQCLVLDQVFQAFFLTNVRNQRSLDGILDVNSTRFMCFCHANIWYRATIRRRDEDEGEVLHLQLPNNGFVYTTLGSQHTKTFSRHKSHTWQSLPANAALRCFPTISEMCKSRYDHGRVYYDSKTQRVDIQLRPKPDNNVPMLEISFEPGYPEEKAAWQPVFQ